MTDTETMAEFVRRGIEKLFYDIAEQWAQNDEPGNPTLTIFQAQTYMLNAWDRYLKASDEFKPSDTRPDKYYYGKYADEISLTDALLKDKYDRNLG